MLADAHFSFYIEHRRASGLTKEELKRLPLRDCYMYGTSTANIRIESFWNGMIRRQTGPWLQYFHYLQAHGFYSSDLIADQVILLFIFIPILRHEIHTFVLMHNDHRIRRQDGRINHIPDRPNTLYQPQDGEPEYG